MIPLLRTNDVVLISFVEALLKDAGIPHIVLDGNMSVVEGSLGIIARRVMVDEDDRPAAVRLMIDAGLEHELAPEKGRKQS
ncbi:DUF2007 domain-containing protein [Stappia sp. ES.058]|uniref:putative signal transducing protein n=1 Tax=Stappia sp. ES.058 TaxID=1881061 RepID=UPI00087B0125|nr:DUF2007 domain-containing protein [Stappia sp. ES.058]SDU22544.1 Putative signal transducing protein [Stappia sp. ES.058]